MKFSPCTASFRQLSLLKRAVRSVADQKGVEVDHIIQDAGTGIELEHWVRWNTAASLLVAPDKGMYDGLNRAFERVTGDVFSILNCDEQYLPGTLARVQAEFEAHPEADMVVGDCLLIDANSKLLAFRKSTPLRPSMILTDHLYDLTCAMFFRRRLLDRGIRFDTRFRAAGDADWIVRLLQSGIKIRYIRHYCSTFSILDTNISIVGALPTEGQWLREITPRWALIAKPLLRRLRHVEKMRVGGYSSRPIDYAVYVNEEAEMRTAFHYETPGFKHPWA